MLAVLLLLAWHDDSAGLARLLHGLNRALARSEGQAIARLFAPDAELWNCGQPVAKSPAAIARLLAERPPWSETTPPHFEPMSTQVEPPGLAIIRGRMNQFGSLIVRRVVPATLAVRFRGGQWQIISLRLFPPGRVGCIFRTIGSERSVPWTTTGDPAASGGVGSSRPSAPE